MVDRGYLLDGAWNVLIYLARIMLMVAVNFVCTRPHLSYDICSVTDGVTLVHRLYPICDTCCICSEDELHHILIIADIILRRMLIWSGLK